MRPESVTRLRNAFAQAALEWAFTLVSAESGTTSVLPFSSMTETDWREAVTLWRGQAVSLLDAAALRACPACGRDRSRFLFFSYDDHPFHECLACGCWFEPKVIDAALFEAFFERCPAARILAQQMMQSRGRQEGQAADMARVGSYLDQLAPLLSVAAEGPVVYLDVGCGVGHSLRAGLARGFSVQGVEMDGTAVELARADGLPVALLGELVPPGPYHLLSFWETLEHITNPLEAIEAYLPLMAPAGLVAITVPNLNALATRVLRESCAWVHGGYNTPGHVNLFHVPSLQRLLERAGLAVLDVDVQFSANPVELAGHLTGGTRGAFDVLRAESRRATMSAPAEQSLASVWPGVALLERLTLTGPILQVVACRKGEEFRFAAAVAVRRAQRQQEIETEARALIAQEPDYKGIAAALEQEVARRDDLLRQLEQASQVEIARRDDLLARVQHTANDLQQQLAAAQDSVNLRDDLLIAAQQTLARTVDERVRSVLRAVRRRMDR